MLQFVSTASIKGSIQGKILCLHGPPGVGKTSLAFALGESLGRKVTRISLGGENQVSELKGHRRTYVEARPGKIIKALIDSESENCVIILDEIDKIGSGSHEGDPEHALLEILDPKQNEEFTDNFLDFPVDLSRVFFICVGNDISRLSKPLLDRMDTIELSSYSFTEKREIFQKHVLGNYVRDFGMEDLQSDFVFDDACVDMLIKSYCQDPGVRSLKKFTSKILQRVAFELHERNSESLAVRITPENLYKYIGLPVYNEGLIYQGKV